MRRLLLTLAGISLAASPQAQPNRLNLYIWSDYIDPKVVSDFEKQFKCKVNLDLYEDAPILSEAPEPSREDDEGPNGSDHMLNANHAIRPAALSQ